MDLDALNEIARYSSSRVAGRLALCCSMLRDRTLDIVRSLRYRNATRFIAKIWLNMARVSKVISDREIKNREYRASEIARILKEDPTAHISLARILMMRLPEPVAHPPLFYTEELERFNYCLRANTRYMAEDCVSMLIIDTDDFPENVTVIVSKEKGRVISQFNHNVIQGFPIFHIFTCGIVETRGTVLSVRIEGSEGGEVVLSKISSYGLRDGNIPR
jgi:hypothetical protein